jgi:ABC-type multidrug transport system fused ATPase/permease subunit
VLLFSLRLVRPYWRWLAIVTFAMVVETIMTLASPWPLKIVLDSVLDSRPLPGWWTWITGPQPGPLALLNVAAGATIVIALLQAGSAYIAAYYTVSIGQWIAHDLRSNVYAHLQRLSMSYYDRQQTGPLISTITDDINAVQDFASTSLLDLLIDTLTVAGMLAVMFALNWRFTIVAIAVTPLVALFAIRLRGAVKSAMHAVRRRQSEIVSIVQEGLGAIRVVKAFAQGAFERQRLEAKSRESVEAALHARRVRSLLGPVVTVLTAAGTAAVLWFGTREVLAGAMTAGALVIFLNYLGRLFRPIQALARASTDLAQAAVGLDRVRTVLDADERLPRAPQPWRPEIVQGRVEFRNVTFAYVPGRPVLSDITFAAQPGQLIGLVGRSGSGKSSLVALIPRFYDASSGGVAVDDVDVRQWAIVSLRRRIAFVLQETQIFLAPVWQNSLKDCPRVTTRSSARAARRSQADNASVLGLPGPWRVMRRF